MYTEVDSKIQIRFLLKHIQVTFLVKQVEIESLSELQAINLTI